MFTNSGVFGNYFFEKENAAENRRLGAGACVWEVGGRRAICAGTSEMF